VWAAAACTPAASLRVEVIDSFTVPAEQGVGPGHELLTTEAVINGWSELQWLLDGVWSVYAGAGPAGLLRGTWSKTRHTLVFSHVGSSELSAVQLTDPKGAQP
jgi:hypothetical protein